MRNYHEIFRKDVTYDNAKSNKKSGLHHFSEKHISKKTTGVGGHIELLPNLFKVNTRYHFVFDIFITFLAFVYFRLENKCISYDL